MKVVAAQVQKTSYWIKPKSNISFHWFLLKKELQKLWQIQYINNSVCIKYIQNQMCALHNIKVALLTWTFYALFWKRGEILSLFWNVLLYTSKWDKAYCNTANVLPRLTNCFWTSRHRHMGSISYINDMARVVPPCSLIAAIGSFQHKHFFLPSLSEGQ